jgi:hypothetical protein
MSDVPERVTEDGCDIELDCTYTPDGVTGHMDHQMRCGCIPVDRRETGPTETQDRLHPLTLLVRVLPRAAAWRIYIPSSLGVSSYQNADDSDCLT